MSTGPWRGAAVLLMSALAGGGCLDALGPDVGPAQADRCVAPDSDPALDVHFRADVLEGVFAARDIDCARCHTPGGDNPVGVRDSGFDLSTYATLRVGGARSGADIVIAGNPCDSVLVQKLGEAPPFGARMPRNGPPYLTSAQVQVVRDWIAEGARDN